MFAVLPHAAACDDMIFAPRMQALRTGSGCTSCSACLICPLAGDLLRDQECHFHENDRPGCISLLPGCITSTNTDAEDHTRHDHLCAAFARPSC